MTARPSRSTAVIVAAGRRVDSLDATPPRFPLGQVPHVRRKIRAQLADAAALAVVSSAACGADLLVLEAAFEREMRRIVILPFEPPVFRELSVTDRPSSASVDWGTLFDSVIAAVAAQGDLLVLGSTSGASETARSQTTMYRAVNERILEEGQNAALVLDRPDAVDGLVIWDRERRGADDLTAAFYDLVVARGWPVREVDTVPHSPLRTAQDQRAFG